MNGVVTSEMAIADVCNEQHYFQPVTGITGTKTWVCVRCLHARPFGVSA